MESCLEALKGYKHPLAYIDLDRFDANCAALVKRASGIPIRVASKSVRSVALLKRVLSRPGFAGILAYSGWEAAHLCSAGFGNSERDEVVIAYPVVGAEELSRVALLVKAGKKIVLMVDREEHLFAADQVARKIGTRLPIAFDFDLSTSFPGLHFGVRRSALTSDAAVSLLLSRLSAMSGLSLEGVMGYEAQIAGVPDRSPIVRFLKRLSWPRVRARRERWVALIKSRGHTLRFVNGGGTGSLEQTRTDSSITEIAAGSGLFSPTLFDGYRAFKHEPAAGFALQVTRKPRADIATCFSGGFVASGTPGWEKTPTPIEPPGLRLLPHEGTGEVQTPLQGEAARHLKIGDSVLFRHAKAGELCERFNELHLISKNQVVDVVPTYRGEGQSFG